MTNWKEKGFVPDSDDSDDLVSRSKNRNFKSGAGCEKNKTPDLSQAPDKNLTTADTILCPIAGPASQNHLPQKCLTNSPTTNGDKMPTCVAEDGLSRFCPELGIQEVVKLDVSPQSGLLSHGSSSSVINCQGSPQTPETGQRYQFSTVLSSPQYPKAFKIPKPFWEELEDENSSIEAATSNSKLPIQDDISKSYVQISSPVSTTISSPPSSLPDVFEYRRSESPDTNQAVEGQNIVPHTNNPFSNERPEHAKSNSTEYSMKRALRQRNLIQIHPYIVEQEKYRQSLKARGIAPLRILQSQENRGNLLSDPTSPNHLSEESDSQEFDPTTASQSSDKGYNTNPSKSPTVYFGLPSGTVDPISLSFNRKKNVEVDQKFPDIQMLLNERNIVTPRFDSILKKGTPSPKIQSEHYNKIISRPHHECSANNRRSCDSKTSTLIKMPKAQPGRCSESSPSSVVSISSLESIYKPTYSDKPDWEPLTNPTSDFNSSVDAGISSNLKSNVDDPFASDSDKFSHTDSSSDESIQLRRVGKKIRGVLPASHLRLDAQNDLEKVSRITRNTFIVPPDKNMSRKGIAIPKVRTNTSDNSVSSPSGLNFLADDDDEDDGEEIAFGIIREEENSISDMENVSEYCLKGFAEEDNSIDQMLPSRKRQTSRKSRYSVKKRKLSDAALQTRITPYVRKPFTTLQPIRSNKKFKSNILKISAKQPQGKPLILPCLSIIDVIDSTSKGFGKLPDFIKVAVRTAKCRRDQGRHSSFGKSIRLATIEDTNDVISILAKWRSGLITQNMKPKESVSATTTPKSHSDQKFIGKTSSLRSMLGKYPGTSKTSSEMSCAKPRNIQKSLDGFLFSKPTVRTLVPPELCSFPYRTETRKKPTVNSMQRMRPAQLESSKGEKYIESQSSTNFKVFKTKIDKLYARSLTQPIIKSNIPLRLFLEGVDNYDSSIKKIQEAQIREDINGSAQVCFPALIREKKRTPKRIDVGAIKYRQPSNPLILGFLNRGKQNKTKCYTRLLGLAGFGTKYPIHFDIFPLPSGTFFTNCTFIGSGRLKKVLQESSNHQNSQPRVSLSLNVGEKRFSWYTWNEVSASEVGVCFDLLSDYLTESGNLARSSTVDAKEIILFVLDYSQNSVSFDGLLDQNNYLCRMIHVIQEFSSRLNSDADLSGIQREQRIVVLSISSVLVFHLLQTARSNHECSLAFELEELLKIITSQCANLLLLHGLESIRKLYDNLQYYSYRKTGIDSKQHIAEGWVIIIKILEAARIQKGSFWDVINNSLQVKEISNSLDAISMENLWYSMFSLLPLCEFDEFGHVIPGQRQTTSFDNWSIPQNLLKRVLSLYVSNPRQSFGFNEYCKSILIRCHHLMVEWGWWKCSGLIGSIFDFFASQSLSHLRNEEVYHSPNFLGKLDDQPSLDIEPDDSCFHVFLKIIALQFKHLDQVHDIKAIRNLGTRLLPNHDRKYPKEEEIHHHDLASLRNHHDLLCTLFWSIPAEYRPSISLIQGLVIDGRSHREACLINLESWENLAKFLVTHTTDPKIYQPFKIWQSSFFSSLYNEFVGVEVEAQQQAKEIYRNRGNLLTETHINEIITANKKNIIATMCRSINAMGRVIRIVKNDSMIKQALNHDILSQALALELHNQNQLSDSLLIEVTQVLVNCMDQIELLYPIASDESQNSVFGNGDSQDSIDIMNWSRLEMISLLDSLLGCFWPVMRKRISTQDSHQSENSIVIRLVDCLGRSLSLTTENDVKISGFDVGIEWLCSLVDSEENSIVKNELTIQLNQKGHFLCQTSDLLKHNRSQIIRTAICKMNNLLVENSTETEIGLTQKHAQRYFSEILGEVMKSMQRVLETLDPNSENHIRYLNLVRSIITYIKRYASEFRTLTEFFIHPSVYYWPHDSDPNLYAAGIISYCVRLGHQQGKTSFELFYYLHSGWKNALISDRLQEYKKYVVKGMKRKEFTEFMMTEFIPSILQVGFCRNGWILCSTFLPTINYRVRRLLEMPMPHSSWIFEHFINILKIILNGTKSLIGQFSDGIRGAHPKHRGILTVVYQFWMQNAATICQYMERYPDVKETVSMVTDPLSKFIYHSLKSFEAGVACQHNFSGDFDVVKGKFCDNFFDFFEKEINEFWQFSDDSCFRVIVRARSKELSTEQSLTFTLEEVLRGELANYEMLFHIKDGPELAREPNLFIEELII